MNNIVNDTIQYFSNNGYTMKYECTYNEWYGNGNGHVFIFVNNALNDRMYRVFVDFDTMQTYTQVIGNTNVNSQIYDCDDYTINSDKWLNKLIELIKSYDIDKWFINELNN